MLARQSVIFGTALRFAFACKHASQCTPLAHRFNSHNLRRPPRDFLARVRMHAMNLHRSRVTPAHIASAVPESIPVYLLSAKLAPRTIS